MLTPRILLDRGSVEVFAGDGDVAFSLPPARSSRPRRLTVSSSRGEVRVASGHAQEMEPIWP